MYNTKKISWHCALPTKVTTPEEERLGAWHVSLHAGGSFPVLLSIVKLPAVHIYNLSIGVHIGCLYIAPSCTSNSMSSYVNEIHVVYMSKGRV